MSNRPRRNVDVDILFNVNVRRKNHTVREFSGTIVADGEQVEQVGHLRLINVARASYTPRIQEPENVMLLSSVTENAHGLNRAIQAWVDSQDPSIETDFLGLWYVPTLELKSHYVTCTMVTAIVETLLMFLGDVASTSSLLVVDVAAMAPGVRKLLAGLGLDKADNSHLLFCSLSWSPVLLVA